MPLWNHTLRVQNTQSKRKEGKLGGRFRARSKDQEKDMPSVEGMYCNIDMCKRGTVW